GQTATRRRISSPPPCTAPASRWEPGPMRSSDLLAGESRKPASSLLCFRRYGSPTASGSANDRRSWPNSRRLLIGTMLRRQPRRDRVRRAAVAGREGSHRCKPWRRYLRHSSAATDRVEAISTTSLDRRVAAGSFGLAVSGLGLSASHNHKPSSQS